MVAGDPDTLVSFLVCRGVLLSRNESVRLGDFIEYSPQLVMGSESDLSVWVSKMLDKGRNLFFDREGIHVQRF